MWLSAVGGCRHEAPPASAIASTPSSSPTAGDVGASRGYPAAPVSRRGDLLEIVGEIEVPLGSRLQLAQAAADAAARNELAKAIAVAVATLELDIARTDGQEVTRFGAEVAQAFISGLPPAEHRIHKRLDGPGGGALQVIAIFRLPLAAARDLLVRGLGSGASAQPQADRMLASFPEAR